MWSKFNYAFKKGWDAIGYSLKEVARRAGRSGLGKPKQLVWAHKGSDGEEGHKAKATE